VSSLTLWAVLMTMRVAVTTGRAARAVVGASTSTLCQCWVKSRRHDLETGTGTGVNGLVWYV
jgi:hypothetical protein